MSQLSGRSAFPFTHDNPIQFLALFWGNSFAWFSPHLLFSHINCVSLGTQCGSGSTSQLACSARYWRGDVPSSRLLLFAAMIQAERHFNRPLSARWGRLWRTPASLWAHWLSDTECVCSSTPLGSCISCPVIVCIACISFFVHFCSRRWMAVPRTAAKWKTAAAKAQNVWISLVKVEALDFNKENFICYLKGVTLAKWKKLDAF